MGLGEPKPKKTREDRILEWATRHRWDRKVTLIEIQNTIFSQAHLCKGLHEDLIVGIAKQVFDQVKAKRVPKPR